MNLSEELLSLRSLHNAPTVELFRNNGKGKVEIRARVECFNQMIAKILGREKIDFFRHDSDGNKIEIHFKAAPGDALRIARILDSDWDVGVDANSSESEIVFKMSLSFFDKIIGVLGRLEVVKSDDEKDDYISGEGQERVAVG